MAIIDYTLWLSARFDSRMLSLDLPSVRWLLSILNSNGLQLFRIGNTM
jgi:hypothetical protein